MSRDGNRVDRPANEDGNGLSPHRDPQGDIEGTMLSDLQTSFPLDSLLSLPQATVKSRLQVSTDYFNKKAEEVARLTRKRSPPICPPTPRRETKKMRPLAPNASSAAMTSRINQLSTLVRIQSQHISQCQIAGYQQALQMQSMQGVMNVVQHQTHQNMLAFLPSQRFTQMSAQPSQAVQAHSSAELHPAPTPELARVLMQITDKAAFLALKVPKQMFGGVHETMEQVIERQHNKRQASKKGNDAVYITVLASTCTMDKFGGDKKQKQTDSKKLVQDSGWTGVVDTDSPSADMQMKNFMDTHLATKTADFDRDLDEPLSIQTADGFQFYVCTSPYLVKMGDLSHMEFADKLHREVSEGGQLFAADPHYQGNAMLTVLLLKAGFDPSRICPAPKRAAGAGREAMVYGDYTLLKESKKGGLVIEVKHARPSKKTYKIDSHGRSLITNKYDLLLAFTDLLSRKTTKASKKSPELRKKALSNAMVTC
jgi:hypothetical protein